MSTSTIIPKNNPFKFMNWLYFRLKNKHKEDQIVLDRVSDIIHNYKIVNTTIHPMQVDELCARVFPHFILDEGMGFDEDYKNQLRQLVITTIRYVGAELANKKEDILEKDFEFESLGK